VFGRQSRCLYAVWSNPAPGVSSERFRGYYEDVHRPDTLAIGHFERSYRYEAHSGCRARYLTLWEAEYADLATALERVRKGALALREQGRIWPVQEVVFHQFVFASVEGPAPELSVEVLTTVQNDWRTRAPGQHAAAWARDALPHTNALRVGYPAQFLYGHDGRFLWLGETSAPADALGELWRGRAAPGLPPLGRPVPIFPPEGEAAPEPDEPISADPNAAWVAHWTPL